MNESLLGFAVRTVERGLAPDPLIRAGIRRLCAQRLAEAAQSDPSAFLRGMDSAPIAPVPSKANEQHYEVPPEFFGFVLGEHRKYSSCLWTADCKSLAHAEAVALQQTCAHAEIRDGQNILELGCGWGSLTLWMAKHYPHSRITAVSNSLPQRVYIDGEAQRRGLRNIRVVTADMNAFEAPDRYQRVVSVEMFEHMRNYRELLTRIAGWLAPEGRLFVHIFCHRRHLYEFDTEGEHNWMGRHFFTGGIMPCQDIFTRFPGIVRLAGQWTWDGTHYQRTADAWLANLDRNRRRIWPILTATYGRGEEKRWFHRWRVFFLACSELFGYAGGTEWRVGHYLMDPVR